MPGSGPSQPHTTGAPIDRRCFCAGLLAAGLGLACSGGTTTPDPVPSAPAGGLRTTSDTRSALLAQPSGTVRDYRNLGNFFLIRDSTGIYAMTAICTHLGCTVGLPVGAQISCPCHGSQYDLAGGNLQGPAIVPLAHFEVTEPSPGGMLVVDTGKTVPASTRLS